MSDLLDIYWGDVEDAVQDAHLIAWDTCHKIYLAMDEVQAEWFRENYAPDVVTGTPEHLLATLREWYENSCGLRFISAVTTNETDPNEGFESLIPQGADWGDEDDEEDEEDEDDYEDEEV
jgi:hypothetical protein